MLLAHVLQLVVRALLKCFEWFLVNRYSVTTVCWEIFLAYLQIFYLVLGINSKMKILGNTSE